MRPLILLVLIHLLLSCTKMAPKKEMNYNSNGAYYTILEFPTGSSDLNEKNKNVLKEFYQLALQKDNKSSEIKNVQILIWPDKKNLQEKNEIELINKRGLVVQNYLNENLNAKVKYSITNMLIMPNRIDELIKSDDNKQKKVFEKTEPISSSQDEDLAKLINNKASKVLIMVNYE